MEIEHFYSGAGTIRLITETDVNGKVECWLFVATKDGAEIRSEVIKIVPLNKGEKEYHTKDGHVFVTSRLPTWNWLYEPNTHGKCFNSAYWNDEYIPRN